MKAPHDDVRMRGFAERATLQTALAWLDDAAELLGEVERLPISQVAGGVLATDIDALIDVPTFDRSAMDGYAIRASETNGASAYNPLRIKLIGESLPGKAFIGELVGGTAVRIMTGAPIPTGADAVIPAEHAVEAGNSVEILQDVPTGKHIGRRGEDVSQGARLFSRGRRLRPQDVGLLASVGITEIKVVHRPRVRIVVTGDELIEPGQARGPDQIYESNSYVLRALVERDGGLVESVRHVQDQPEEIQEALGEGVVDVMLVTGGSSVGTEDHTPRLVAALGELAIHGIAMRPSSPTGLGRIGKTVVILLPGNPVSCLCAYDFFGGRAIRRLGGQPTEWPYRKSLAKVVKKIVSSVGRVDYCRVAISQNEVSPLAISGASILSSTTRADGFVIIPSEREGYAPGESIEVFHYGVV